MALRNISASVFRAAICSPPGEENGAGGAGLESTWIISVAAMTVASAEDRFGILPSCGEKSTVREMRLVHVLGI